MVKYIQSNYYFDYETPGIQAYLNKVVDAEQSVHENALSIYYAVREDWSYNPSVFSFQKSDWKASCLLSKKDGHCLDKAILMITLLRAIGVPARLCLAKVKNHIAAESIVEALGTDELVPHGYVSLFLNEKWVKATPAFNQKLCEKLGVTPLEFNGNEDSIFQEFDKTGSKFMGYLADYGHFDDVPFDYITELILAHYPAVREKYNPGQVILIGK